MGWTSTTDTRRRGADPPGQGTNARRRGLPRLLALTALAVSAVMLVSQPLAATAAKQGHRARSGTTARAGISHGRIGVADARALTGRTPTVTGGATSAGAPAPVAPTFYGLNAQALFRLPSSQWDAQLSKLAATGVGTVRFDTGWSAVEPTAPSAAGHKYNWAHLDQIVAALAQHHLQGLPIVDYAAPWARAATGGGPTGIPPADPAVFAEFAQAVAARYGPGGAFWAANPAVPPMPIDQYEIWNEENSEYFFHGVDAGLYAAMYADSRAAIHGVDPAASVIVGGLVPTLNPIGWLDAFLAALPAHGQEVDAIGWHPYYGTSSAVYASLKALHTDLSAHGLNPPVLLTEVNGSEGANQPQVLSELAQTLPRSDCNVTAMVVHTWTPLPEDQGVGAYSIADEAGNLNPAGLSFSSALQAAKSSGVGIPAPICTTPVAKARASSAPAKRPRHRPQRHRRVKHRS